MRGAPHQYHEGERAVQERSGEQRIAARNGAMIGNSIIPGARPFLAAQTMIAVAVENGDGEVWASLWFGTRGFASAADEGSTLVVDRSRTLPLDVDPVGAALREGSALGVLAIELETRRRLRVNGTVRTLSAAALTLEVEESFPNCPKYIAKRHLRSRGAAAEDAPHSRPAYEEGSALDALRLATIARTDTMFVGSAHPSGGADASHRGGDPGFVRAVDERTLRIPDYSGNSMFQTLGNLHASPRAGLVFLDFEGRRLLHVTGTTTLRFDEVDASLVTGGTGRAWDLHVTRWVEGSLPNDVDAELLERSRVIPQR